ncbi:phospholipid N-methyltransferase [Lachnospiraceae bacterium JC7]|nr:phospholipid N-methyltransferase [Lachnospiraceae bacterium JC7]
MSFIFEYIKHPRSIGAVAPSGRKLSRKMVKPIDFDTAEVIVEYGPGTGSFTKELIDHRKPETVLFLIEQNEEFCRNLAHRFRGEKNIHLIHGNAEYVMEYLRAYGFDHADYIISGLPFTSLPGEISEKVLNATKTALGDSGEFITFQYSLVKRDFFERYLSINETLKEMWNLPPAYVFVMKNRRLAM